jgi:MraZ protein
MFRGNHPARVDEKGRLKLPSDHRSELDGGGEGKQVFYITSKDGKRAEIYPLKEWNRIESDIAKLPSGPAKKRLLNWTNYYGQTVEMDSQGRLLLPQLVREDAKLAGDVAVIGQETYLAVANNAQYRMQLDENPLTDEDLETLGIIGL